MKTIEQAKAELLQAANDVRNCTKQIPTQFSGMSVTVGSSTVLVYSSGCITLFGINHLPSAEMEKERLALEEAYLYQQSVIAAAESIAKGMIPPGLYMRQGSKFVKYN